MKNYSTIIQSIITEKSSAQQALGQYTFLVRRDATKIDVKMAVKAIYGVDAAKVRTIITPKKVRLVGRGREMTKRPLFKKAIVRLKGKQTIDPNKIKEIKPKKKK